MKTIAITGGNGFIGGATARMAQLAGHNVKILDRPDSIMGSLHQMEGADHVIHLAGVLGTSELFDYVDLAVNTNIKGTYRILEWCRENNAGFTGITMPPVFPSVYTATKVCADRFATAWHHGYGIPVSKVRAYNAYGAGQKHGFGHPQKILPTFATEAWANRPIPIWGDGEQMIDLIHVDQLATMLVMATEFGNDETFDGGTGTAVSVNTLAAYVLWVTGSTAGVKHMPMRKGELRGVDIRATGEGWDLLKWNPQFRWDDVTKAIESYKP